MKYFRRYEIISRIRVKVRHCPPPETGLTAFEVSRSKDKTYGYDKIAISLQNLYLSQGAMEWRWEGARFDEGRVGGGENDSCSKF